MVLRKLLYGCAGAAILVQTLPPAQAQQSASEALAAVPLDRLCRKDGSLEHLFGSTAHGIAPTHKPGQVNRLAPAELAPFAGIAMNATKYSNRLFSVEFSGKVGDKLATRAAVTQLADRFAAAGWIRARRSADEDGTFTDPAPAENGALFYAEAGIEGPGGKPGVRLEIQPMFGELYLVCEHSAEMARQLREALGEMPMGTSRPQFIPASRSIGAVQADCLDPGRREKIIEAAMLGAMQPPGFDRLDFEERLADWKIMMLVSSGKISRDAISDKIIGLIDGPESLKSMEAGLDMLKGIEPMMAAADKGDRAGLCKALVAMMEKGEAAAKPVAGASGDATSPQWRATHALLDAQAKRLGVTFPE